MVTKENVALMYHAPGKNRAFNAFVLDKSYYGPFDETTCIDWTDDSKYSTSPLHLSPPASTHCHVIPFCLFHRIVLFPFMVTVLVMY